MNKIPRSLKAILYVGIAICLVICIQIAFKSIIPRNSTTDSHLMYSELTMQKLVDKGERTALVVFNGDIIAMAVATVDKEHDPTAHAEINAIRIACRKLRTTTLNGCAIYLSNEPCAMCSSVIEIVKPDTIYVAKDYLL